MKPLPDSFKIFLQKLAQLPNSIAIFAIVWYRRTVSPSVGVFRFIPGYPRPSCVFYPTCSEYAISCFRTYDFLKAFRKTIDRIRRCTPKTPPQIDLP